MDSITQLTQEQRAAFRPAASRYPHMSIDGATIKWEPIASIPLTAGR
ncbi:hypothetical protein [Streptomyces sp. NPDC047525]